MSHPLYRVVQPSPPSWGTDHIEHTNDLEDALRRKHRLYRECCRYPELPRIEVHAGNGSYRVMTPQPRDEVRP